MHLEISRSCITTCWDTAVLSKWCGSESILNSPNSMFWVSVSFKNVFFPSSFISFSSLCKNFPRTRHLIQSFILPSSEFNRYEQNRGDFIDLHLLFLWDIGPDCLGFTGACVGWVCIFFHCKLKFSLHFAEVMTVLRAEQHAENILHNPVADDGSWQGYEDEGWLCRHTLPCGSAHSSQHGDGELMCSYPTK